ncbi:hypothetical protein KKA15_06715 [Patescibacteria group bacterium]|nr:hypothetical protein [Patescibacteria group bacterium]
MKNETFKFISKKSLTGDPLILVITEQTVQDFAEANYGRKLSDEELQKASNESFQADKYCWIMMQFIDVAVRYTLFSEE